MADIDFGQLSEALNDKADTDLRNVDTTAKADAVIDYQEPTSANNYTWYRKYKSGWVEQGGHLTWSNNPLTPITLPISMFDGNYTVYVQQIGTVQDTSNSVSIYNRTSTTFTLVPYTNNREATWQVSGKSAN